MRRFGLVLLLLAALGLGPWPWVSLSHGQAGLASQPCVGVGLTNTAAFQNLGCTMDSLQATYAATAQSLVIAAAATDIACISGAAAPTVVRLKKIRVSGLAGTAATATVYLTKHVSADTGGTLATGTALPVPYRLDSTAPAPAATTQSWTANPTINDGSPGIIAAQSILFPLATGTNSTGVTPFAWGDGPAEGMPTLRSPAQQVCVNLNAATITSPLISVEFDWTEAAN